ncbi:hypothetical protein AQUCO_01000268v1 [Aquilegia coerulea]|uniref:Pectinesterase n=1 Tax=Aquilegia coerulea TaxID=218851 RepID=A0A2G5E932_AQUCA|nr:hypothetical protein AQUCO_01000268v1 [Aquilegia coerulea]
MAVKHFIPLLVILVYLIASSLSATTTPNRVCNSTVNPYFCRETLPSNVSWEVNDYSHFSFHRSLAMAKTLSFLMTKYLEKLSNLPLSTIRALEDCKELADLTDMQAKLSAILTNQQTCLEGLEMSSSAWNATSDLHTPMYDGNKMFSLSLALFKKAFAKSWDGAFPTNEDISRKRIIHAYLKGVHVNTSVVVNPDGTGDFTTIMDAVNAAPNKTDISNGYYVIFIVAGVYEEYVNVIKNKMNLMMIGDGINRTVITGNRSVGDGWTTFNSATFIVVGQGFVGVDMTIRNTAGPSKGQAVALRSGADMSTFYRCSFEGYQDTLYSHSLRQFYRECDIYGTVDFIFGNAAVVLQNCNIYPTLPIHGQGNEITAQGRTDPNQNTGITVQNCTIRASDALASSNDTTKTYLGRPWKEYSRTVYMQSFMDSLIVPLGWDIWSGDFALATLYYAEYNNTGPGSDTTNRVTWPGYHVIDGETAANFTVSNLIAGDAWLPYTGVPYTAGLY